MARSSPFRGVWGGWSRERRKAWWSVCGLEVERRGGKPEQRDLGGRRWVGSERGERRALTGELDGIHGGYMVRFQLDERAIRVLSILHTASEEAAAFGEFFVFSILALAAYQTSLFLLTGEENGDVQ